MTTILDALVSAGQAGRIKPQGFTPSEGEWCFVLGSDAPGSIEYLVPGDTFAVEQVTVDFVPDLLRARGMMRLPALPSGFGWTLTLTVDTYDVTFDLTSYAEREVMIEDLSSSTSGGGTGNVTITATFTGPGTDPVLVELPALYLDTVLQEAGVGGLGLVARFPAPDQVGVLADLPHGVQLTVASWDGSAVLAGTVDVEVDGVPAVVAGVVQAPFSGAVTAGVGLGGLDVLVELTSGWATFDSEALVPISVTAETTLGGLLDETYTFTIEDYAPPMLPSARAVSSTVVELTFSEAVQLPAPASFAISGIAGAVWAPLDVVSVAAGSSPELLLLTLSDVQTFGATYTVVATGVQDTTGNQIEPPSDTTTWLGFQPAWPECRSFSLWEMLPGLYKSSDLSGDLYKFTASLQDIVDVLLAQVDAWTDIIDPDTANEEQINAMLFGLGNPFGLDLTLPDKRLLLSVLVSIYQSKGTKTGIEDAIFFFLGIEVEVVPLNDPESAWVLDVSELGEDTELFTSDLFTLYSFDVISQVDLTSEQLAKLIKVVQYMKVAHEHIANIHQPSDPPPFAPWLLGESELGFDTDLAA